VPRIAEAREAAAPSSPSQKARYRRILRTAADLAARNGLERVQMHEVAKNAGVAIGTLYRYFPSKTHLFTAVMGEQVDWLFERTSGPRPGEDPVESVYQLLVTASRHLLRQPTLAAALFTSANSAHAARIPEAGRIDRRTRDLLLHAFGVENPTAQESTAVWLLIQCWYGLLLSSLNGRTSLPDAEADLRVACRLLLAPCVAARAGAELPVTGKQPIPTGPWPDSVRPSR
jgi:AcrR family transcriptional regulator